MPERPLQLGPAMAKLDTQRQVFVQALFTNGGNRTAAARAAGYPGAGIKMRASRLCHDREIQEAVQECGRETFISIVPKAAAALMKMAASEKTPHESRRKIFESMMNRAGMAAPINVRQEHAVTVERPTDDLAMIDRIWSKMIALGLDPVPILGARRAALMMPKPVVTEAEYAEGPEPVTTSVEEET